MWSSPRHSKASYKKGLSFSPTPAEELKNELDKFHTKIKQKAYIIKPADKGSAVVIMNLKVYIAEKVNENFTPHHMKLVDLSVSHMLSNTILKNIIPPPGWPILSANDCPTERFSAFVDHFLS